MNDPRGLAPEGWHIPSDDEWEILIDHLGGKDVAGTKMKSTSGWASNGNGTNESGFSGLPGGYRTFACAEFLDVSEYGAWWSSAEYGSDFAWAAD